MPLGNLYVFHFLDKYLFRLFTYFLIRLFVFLLWRCLNSSYILDINPFSDAWFANISSHSICCVSALWIVSFAVQQLFGLMRSHLSIFALGRKGSTCTLLVRMRVGTAIMETVWWLLEKLKIEPPCQAAVPLQGFQRNEVGMSAFEQP